MCKICIARRWVVDISRDAMQILCLSRAGRWWRAEWEMGELVSQMNDAIIDIVRKTGWWS